MNKLGVPDGARAKLTKLWRARRGWRLMLLVRNPLAAAALAIVAGVAPVLTRFSEGDPASG